MDWDVLRRPEWAVMVALAVGLLIGVERERRIADGVPGPAGLRTFALVGGLGGVLGLIGEPALTVTGAVFVAVAVLAWRLSDRKREPDLTGEVALVLTYALGVLAVSRPQVAAPAGVAVAALLAWRTQLHRLVRETLTERELLEGLGLAVAAAVVLPLLPDRPLDPFGVLNPRLLWTLMVVLMAVTALGNVAGRLFGARYGLTVAGAAAGFVSSTAAVATNARLVRAAPARCAAAAAGGLAATAVSVAFALTLALVARPSLAPRLAAPAGLALLLLAPWLVWLSRRAAAASGDESPPPAKVFDLAAGAAFVALVAGFTLLSRFLAVKFGQAGALVGAAAAGAADLQAAGVSMGTLAQAGRIDDATATTGLMVALTAAMLVKVAVAALGGRGYLLRVCTGLALIVAGAWLGWGLARLVGRLP